MDLSEVKSLLAGCFVRHFAPINVSGVPLIVVKNMSHREIFPQDCLCGKCQTEVRYSIP